MAGFVIVIFFVGVAFAVWYSNLTTTKAAWDTAAQQLQFQRAGVSSFNPGSIVGERQGVRVTISQVQKGGDNKETYTRYLAEYPAVGPPVELKKQHAFSFVGRFFGQTDVLIGDAGFDERVVISTNSPQEVNAFLTPGRKMAILNLFESHDGAAVTERSVRIDTRGTEKSPEKMFAMAKWIVDMGLFLSKPSEVDLALQQQAVGNLGQAVEQLHEINEAAGPEGPNSFTQLLEAEGRMAMGDGAGAAEILDHMHLPENKEALGLRDVAHKHPTPPDPPRPATPPTPPEHAAPVGQSVQPESEPAPALDQTPGPDLSQQTVIDDLFSSHRTGYEVEDHFLENYVGHLVSWTGTVTRSMTYRFDSDFEGTGLKVSIEIGTLENGQLISNTVTAVVQLEDHNEVERDDVITVQGTLHRVDRYMRNIYVRDAQIM